MYGAWVTTADEYIEAARRYRDEIGNLDWIAPQDWMCEDSILAKTGRTLYNHQDLTCRNFMRLRETADDLWVIPVLQGQTLMDYFIHQRMYESRGIDLDKEPVVGLGSVCRLEGTIETQRIIEHLGGLRLHGFGVKTSGLRNYAHLLASADSMAWSMGARYRAPMEGHTHKTCANCLEYALAWREKIVSPQA